MLISGYFPLRAVHHNCNPNIFDDLVEVLVTLLAKFIKIQLSLLGYDVLDAGLNVFEGAVLHKLDHLYLFVLEFIYSE